MAYSNNTKNITVSGGTITVTGVSTAAKQDSQIALETSILNEAVTIANETNSINTKLQAALFAPLMITGQANQLALNNNVMLSAAGTDAIDTTGYSSAVLQIIPAAGTVTAGAITFEGSNDNVTFFSIPVITINSGPSTLATSSYNVVASTQRTVFIPITTRYLKARISTGITGTTTGVQCFTWLKTDSESVLSVPSAMVTAGDAATNPSVEQKLVYGNLFNGSNWDRQRNNEEVQLFASATRSGTNSSSSIVNYNGKGVNLFINVSAVTAATLQVIIEGRDPITGTFVTLIQSAALVVGISRLVVYPGITAVANVSTSDILPRNWRVRTVVTGTDATFSIGYSSQM